MLATVALCLFGHIDPSHFAGALTEEPDLSQVPVGDLTHDQLLSEQKRLEPARTGWITPVVLTAVGGVLIIVGAVVDVVGVFYLYLPSIFGASMVTTTFSIAGAVLLVIGSAMLVAGGVLLAIGLVKLFPALARRREASERREEIQKRLQQLDAPPGEQQPMNPGDVRFEGPRPSMLLATF